MDTAGDSQGDLFSAPKVQISRVVDKYLSDSPAGESQEVEILREMSEVVAALVCFADHIIEAGTATEYAAKLMDRMKQDCEDRKVAWQQIVTEKQMRYDASALESTGLFEFSHDERSQLHELGDPGLWISGLASSWISGCHANLVLWILLFTV